MLYSLKQYKEKYYPEKSEKTVVRMLKAGNVPSLHRYQIICRTIIILVPKYEHCLKCFDFQRTNKII